MLTTSDQSKSKAIRVSIAASRTYLDYNATAPLRAGALSACLSALGTFGNPSSIHAEGRAARAVIENARSQVAALFAVGAEQVAFTSGGTEGANLLLTPALRSLSCPDGAERLITTAAEHVAVLDGHRFSGHRVTVLPVDGQGHVGIEDLRRTLSDGGPALVAVQAANNETGVLQPLREIAALVRAAGGIFVCDAVQIAGRLPFTLAESGADALIVSGHKLGGPKGTGAVVFAEGVSLDWSLLRGGRQERGWRAGTENVTGIAGFGAAAAEAGDLQLARIQALRDRLEGRLREERNDLVVFGGETARLPNTICFAVPGAAADTLLMALDLNGVAVSSGAACSSGKVSPSHVLRAMGVEPALAAGATRVSFGWASTEVDVDRFIDVFAAAMQRMQKRSLPHAA